MPPSINDLTFGVEFEFMLPRNKTREELARHMDAGGLNTQEEIYNHRVRPHWKIVTDGSQSDYTRGTEVVSPILQGEEGLRQMRLACDLIEDFGCRVNRQCGFHVHVGARSFNIDFFKVLFKTYSQFEGIIDQLMAPSRRASENQYCRPIPWGSSADRAADMDQLARHLHVEPRFAAHGSSIGRSIGRYSKLNLESFWRHGTVEFRQHQGTLNKNKAENWVRFCLRLVAYAVGVPMPAQIQATAAAQENESDLIWTPQNVVPNLPTDLEHYTMREQQAFYNRLVRASHRLNLRPRLHEHASTFENRQLGIARIIALHQRLGYVRASLLRQRSISGINADHPLAVGNNSPAQAATTRSVPTPTITAPITLEGLMDLIGATPVEQSYFFERQMELNP